MLQGLFIFIDDDFDDPVYADPAPADFDEDIWPVLCEAVNDALEEEGPEQGYKTLNEYHVAWKSLVRHGISFVAVVTDDVKAQSVESYLAHLARRYLDEVDDPRMPEREGVEDVVIDVIPPWEDEED